MNALQIQATSEHERIPLVELLTMLDEAHEDLVRLIDSGELQIPFEEKYLSDYGELHVSILQQEEEEPDESEI